MSRIHLIAAMAENRVIGRDNQLPWRLPADLKRFKAATMGHVLVMGRKTYESIGRPLPGRRTVVLSRDDGYRPEGVEVASSLPRALELAGEQEVFVAGGGEVYRRALELADDVLLTVVHGEVEGDAFFPPLDPAVWELAEEEHRPADERHAWDLSFQRYIRRDARRDVRRDGHPGAAAASSAEEP
ncbi:MAG: dihydrofolate reductase [Acidobacteriota bacterium]|nr:dihydrofolate reductase [Acidobacteriota bacterium]